MDLNIPPLHRLEYLRHMYRAGNALALAAMRHNQTSSGFAMYYNPHRGQYDAEERHTDGPANSATATNKIDLANAIDGISTSSRNASSATLLTVQRRCWLDGGGKRHRAACAGVGQNRRQERQFFEHRFPLE